MEQTGYGYSGGNYQSDYDEICRLEASLEVLEKKKKDYERIVKGAEQDFNDSCKKLAEYQYARKQLDKFSLKNLFLKLTGKYKEESEGTDRALDISQQNLSNAKYHIQDVKGKLRDIVHEYNVTKSNFEKKRKYMSDTYSQSNEYEKKIQEENLRLHGIIKEIDEAIDAVNQVIEIAKLALEKFKSAKGWGVADLVFDGGIVSDMIKYNKINDAESMVFTLNAAISRMNKELRDVNMVYGVYCEQFGSGMRFLDIAFDNFFLDAAVLGKIENNINRLTQFLGNMSSTKENLLTNKRQVEKEIKR